MGRITRIIVGLAALTGLLAPVFGHAQTLAPQGCPISHCNLEATGVISQPLTGDVSVETDSSLGQLYGEGCSGDGVRLMCLFSKDTSSVKGTLKALDATTLQPLWGSASTPGSYNLQARSAAYGEVPTVFADGTIAAGDAHVLVLYDPTGVALAQLSVSGAGTNYGLTPLSTGYGVVTQSDGVLTLVNLATWQNVGSLTLLDPRTGERVKALGPSSAAPEALYAVAYGDDGVLFSVVIDAPTQTLQVRSSFLFIGRSGAEPVVVTPDVTGLADNLVLLHVRGLIGDPTPQNRLLALADTNAGFQQSWAISLQKALTVAPTVDATSQSVFFQTGATIHQHKLGSGTHRRTFNLTSIAGFAGSFRLNGHLGASSGNGTFTLLLGGASSDPDNPGEFVMAFQPIIAPDTLLWMRRVAPEPANYTGAWNFASADDGSSVCPIAITVGTPQTTISRLCDQ